jgi:hypothetical protein
VLLLLLQPGILPLKIIKYSLKLFSAIGSLPDLVLQSINFLLPLSDPLLFFLYLSLSPGILFIANLQNDCTLADLLLKVFYYLVIPLLFLFEAL